MNLGKIPAVPPIYVALLQLRWEVSALSRKLFPLVLIDDIYPLFSLSVQGHQSSTYEKQITKYLTK